MRASQVFYLAAMVVALTAVAATPSSASISVELAKKCRAMMVQAHPTELYGRTGTAALQRSYFAECIARQGKMDGPERSATGLGATTTGSGSADQGIGDSR